MLALAAGIVAYRGAVKAAERQNAGTMAAADRQIDALRRTERLRARGLAIAIYPELLEMQVDVETRFRHVSMGFTPDLAGEREGFLNVMLLPLLPFMERNIESLYIMESGAASLLQIVSVTWQYNRLVKLSRGNDELDSLHGQLTLLKQAIADALREISPLHDEAAENRLL